MQFNLTTYDKNNKYKINKIKDFLLQHEYGEFIIRNDDNNCILDNDINYQKYGILHHENYDYFLSNILNKYKNKTYEKGKDIVTTLNTLNIYKKDIIDEDFITYNNYLSGITNFINIKSNIRGLYNFDDYDYVIVYMGMGYGKSTLCEKNEKIFLDGDKVIEEWASIHKPPYTNIHKFDWDTYNKKVENEWISNYYKHYSNYKIIFVNNNTYTRQLKGKKLKIIVEYKGINPRKSRRIDQEHNELAKANHQDLYNKEKYKYDITIKYKEKWDINNFFDVLEINNVNSQQYKNDAQQIAKLINKVHNTVDKKYFFSDYKKTVRRRLIVYNVDYNYKQLIPIFDEAFTLLFYKKEKSKKFFNDHILQILVEMNTIEQYVELLVEVGAYIKQTAFLEEWYLFIDNGILCGESEDYDKDEVNKVVDEWINIEKKHTIDNNEAIFFELFEEGVKDYINKLELRYVEDHKTYYEYLSDITRWGLSGSTSIKLKNNNKIETSKGLMKMRQTKWTNALLMDTEDIYSKTINKDHVDVKLVVKVAKGKVRKVMASDTEFYLICNYLDYYLQNTFKTFKHSTLLYNDKERILFWIDFANSSLNDKIKLPLDQGSFDQNCNLQMIMICVDNITNMLFSCGMSKNESLYWKQKVMLLFKNNYLIYENKKIKVKNGLLSGWKWTAMLGTMMNYAELYIVRKLEKRFFNNEITDFNVQGDDILLVLMYNIIIVYFIYIVYVNMSFDINPRKFFNSRKRNEYLRKVSERGVVFGYPARTIISFLQPGIMTEESYDQMEKIQTIINNFYIYLRRGNYDLSCINILKEQMEYELKGSSKLLHYPKSRNGFGYTPLIKEDDNYAIMKHNIIDYGEINDITKLKGVKKSKFIKYVDKRKLYSILADNTKKQFKNKIRWKIIFNKNFKKIEPLDLFSKSNFDQVLNTKPKYFKITHSDKDDIFFENYLNNIDNFDDVGYWMIEDHEYITKNIKRKIILNRFDDSIINSHKYGINLISFIFKRLLYISIRKYLSFKLVLTDYKFKRLKLAIELGIEDWIDRETKNNMSKLYNIVIKD